MASKWLATEASPAAEPPRPASGNQVRVIAFCCAVGLPNAATSGQGTPRAGTADLAGAADVAASATARGMTSASTPIAVATPPIFRMSLRENFPAIAEPLCLGVERDEGDTVERFQLCCAIRLKATSDGSNRPGKNWPDPAMFMNVDIAGSPKSLFPRHHGHDDDHGQPLLTGLTDSEFGCAGNQNVDQLGLSTANDHSRVIAPPGLPATPTAQRTTVRPARM